MIVRVRSKEGTARVTVPDSATIADLFAGAALPADATLSLDPSGAKPIERGSTATLASLGIKHGTMLHAKHAVSAEAAEALAAEAAAAAAAATVSAAVDDDAPAAGRKLTKYCHHPPTGMCAHCLPKDAAEEALEAPSMAPLEKITGAARGADAGDAGGDGDAAAGKPKRPACRNHGPNGSCINCLVAEEAKKPVVKAPEAPTAQAVSVCRGAARAFQQHLQNTGFTNHRCGHAYGRATKQGTRIDAIYEPPQEGSDAGFRLLPDPDLAAVDAVAAEFSLERVGFVLSVPRRDGDHAKAPLSGAELAVASAAHAASKCPEGFVIVTIRPDEGGQASFEVFQLSEQIVRMQKEGMVCGVEDQTDVGTLAVSTPAIVEGKETSAVDVHFFASPVPIFDHQGPFIATFPVENRPSRVSIADLRAHLVQYENAPFVRRLKDFHALIFLTHHLDVKTDMPHLCKAVKAGDNEACSGFQIIIESITAMG